MTPAAFNKFCKSLPHTTHVVQWGNNDVWKVGGKVFAVAGMHKEFGFTASFKVSEIAWEVLKETPGCRPAPYLASRGMKWIQNYGKPGLSDKDLREHIKESHRIVSLGLTKKLQKELGLNQD